MVFDSLDTQWVEELEWAQEGKVYRLKMGKAQLLIASMMTSTPMMLSMNPARAWYAENQCEGAAAELGQHPSLQCS